MKASRYILEKPTYTFIGSLSIPFNHTYLNARDFLPCVEEWLAKVLGIDFNGELSDIAYKVWFGKDIYAQGKYNGKDCSVWLMAHTSYAPTAHDEIKVFIKKDNPKLVEKEGI